MTIMIEPPDGTVEEFVEVDDGVRLRVLSRGEGPPVVFIPGWTCTADFFCHQLAGLADTVRVIAYDPRGHGGSDKPMAGNTFTRRGADLAALIERMDLTETVLVGWSFGIHDMYAYLRDHGTDRIGGVVVLDEPPRVWIDPEQPHAWGEAPLAGDGIVAFLRNVLDSRREFWTDYAAYMIDLDEDVDLAEHHDVARIVELGLQCPDVVAVATMADGLTSDFSAVAAAVSQEVATLVLARSDWASGAEQWTAEHLPDAEFDVIPTHMAFATHPEQVNARLRAFLLGEGDEDTDDDA
jgi:pimeloyl-ACP methyl ester carboxylesterase